MAGPSVSITADATSLRAQIALAQQDLKTFTSALNKTAKEVQGAAVVTDAMTQSLGKNAAGANAATAAISSLKNQLAAAQAAARAAAGGLDETANKAHGAASAGTAVTREFFVMGDEVLRGNFSRIPGSMLVLAEHMGGVLTAVTAMSGGLLVGVAAAGALVGAFAILIVRAYEAQKALTAVYMAALLQGRDAIAAQKMASSGAETMQKVGNVSASTAQTLSNTIATIPALSDASRAALMGLAPALNQVLHAGDASETAKSLESIFRTTSSLKAFATENKLLIGGQKEAFDAAEKAGDAYAAQGIAIDALKARIGPGYDEWIQKTKDYKQALAESGQEGDLTPMGVAVNAPPTPPPMMSQTGMRAESDETVRAEEVRNRYNATFRESALLTSDMANLQKQLAGATTTEQQTELAALIKINQAKQDGLKPAGDMSWAQQIGDAAQQAGYKAEQAAASSGAKRLAITEAEQKAEAAVYLAASKDMTRTDAERAEMGHRALELQMGLIKEEAAGRTVANKKSNEEVVAGYDAQIAAARGNLTLIMAIETEKLNFLKGAYGAASVEYLRAQTVMASIEREETQREIEEAKTAGTGAINDRKAELQLELALRKTTKEQELQAELAFVEATDKATLASVDALVASLAQGTQAYTLAMTDRRRMAVQFATEETRLRAQQVADEMAAAQKRVAPYQQAFEKMTSGYSTMIEGLMAGTTTWKQAEQTAFKDMVGAFLDMTEQILSKWAAALVMKEALNMTADEIMVAQDTTAGWSAIFMKIASLDSGTSYVPHDMVATIHQGEMVVPRYDADMIRGGGGGVGHTFNYAPTINGSGPGVERAVRGTGEDMRQYMQQMMRNGQLSLPGRQMNPH
jgi:hypothetical protein